MIAHVIGATPLAHFTWDETAYLLLDIGFIWNIYLNMEMGLVPQTMAITELDANDVLKTELRSDIDRLMHGESPVRMAAVDNASPIESIELFESGDSRRLVLNCEQGEVVIETQMNAEDPRSSVTIS